MSDQAANELAPDYRQEARQRLEKRRDFKTHLFVYVVVNAVLIAVWAIATPDAIFWPIFPILGWGIGVAGNAWDVFVRKPIREADVDREEQRLRGRAAR